MTLLSKFLGHKKLKIELQNCRPVLYRTARAWTGDDMLADDLVQEALGQGLKNLHQLKSSDKLLSWLFTILHNQWKQHLRSNKTHVDIDSLSLVSDYCPEQEISRFRTVLKVQNAVRGLPAIYREVISLVDLNDLSYTEVAEILDIPIGTVMSRLSRGRKQLAGMLQDEVELPDVKLRRVK